MFNTKNNSEIKLWEIGECLNETVSVTIQRAENFKSVKIEIKEEQQIEKDNQNNNTNNSRKGATQNRPGARKHENQRHNDKRQQPQQQQRLPSNSGGHSDTRL